MTTQTHDTAASTAAGASHYIKYLFGAFPFPPGHFHVHRVRGRESISAPYRFDVTVSSKALVGQDLERLCVGQRALLSMAFGSAPRVVTGVVMSVRSEGIQPNRGGAAQYTLRIVPALALLQHQRGSRIFQDVSIPEVVTRVLDGAGMRVRAQLTRSYPKRSYVTQYDETDLAFVDRLCAEAGIYYYFAQPDVAAADALVTQLAAVAPPLPSVAALAEAAPARELFPEELLVLGDDANYAAVAPTTLHFLGAGGLALEGTDKVTALTVQRSVRSGLAEFRAFDPDRPQKPIVSRAEGNGAAHGSAGEDDGLEAIKKLLVGRALETYEHDGFFLFPDWKDGADEAERIRRREQSDSATLDGRSLCTALSPGHRFALADHPVGAFDAEYTVVAVEHAGNTARDETPYENTFTCIPGATVFAPPRPPGRSVQTVLTGLVAGPEGEDIHTDTHGRIKVLFHWDRRQNGGDAASCWIRVVQPWSGAGWGAQFIPRVGTEVAVAFDGGDPDKPIVVGSLYNGTHPLPFTLPDAKTVSGIRTQSTPGGNGFNELSFDDRADKERVYLHAQRDLEQMVRGDHKLTVLGSAITKVEGSRKEESTGGVSSDVGGSSHSVIRGETHIDQRGSRTDVVGKDLDQRVAGDRTTRIEGHDLHDARGPAEQRYAADLTTRVVGNQTVIVGDHDARRAYTLRVEGTATISAEDNLILEAAGGITLRCGKTTLRIGKDGIELVGDMIRAAGETGGVEAAKDGVKLTSKGVYAHFGDKLLIKTEKATMAMGKEVKVDGEKILLNSPDTAKEEPPPPPPKLTDIELCDDQGRPLPYQRFVIELADGTQRTGATGKDGKASIELPEDGKIRFPELAELEPA